jgi:hypothetical protein
VSTASTGTPDRSARACAQEVERGGPASSSSRAAVAPPPPPPRRLSLTRPKKEHIDTNYQLGQQVRQPTNTHRQRRTTAEAARLICLLSVCCVCVCVCGSWGRARRPLSGRQSTRYTHMHTHIQEHTNYTAHTYSTQRRLYTWHMGRGAKGGRSVANETWGGEWSGTLSLCVVCLCVLILCMLCVFVCCVVCV